MFITLLFSLTHSFSLAAYRLKANVLNKRIPLLYIALFIIYFLIYVFILLKIKMLFNKQYCLMILMMIKLADPRTSACLI